MSIRCILTICHFTQGAVESLDLSPFATRAEVQEQVQQSSGTLADLGGRMEGVEGNLSKLSEQIEELQVTYTSCIIGNSTLMILV